MTHKLSLLWSNMVRIFTNWIPDFSISMRFRGWLYGLMMKEKGKDFQVGSDVRINGLKHLCVGEHVYIGPGSVLLLANEETVIESEVMLAHKVMLTCGNHTLKDGSYRYGVSKTAPIFIGRGSWIAAHAMLMPGINIGKGVVVGANAVVTKDVADFLVVGGVPAKVIKSK